MIDPTAKIECDELIAGPGLTVRAHAEIYGGRVVLGRECFVDEYAVIGGGSAGDLTAGDWLHVGMFAQVNTARPVTLGNEVGIGVGSRIFTHGAWLSEWDGYPCSFDPITVGDRVWLPNATVLPGVTIGSDVVVAAGSVVTSDLASDGLYGGTPARLLGPVRREVDRRAVLERIVGDAGSVVGDEVWCDGARFHVADRKIEGPVTAVSEWVRNELRRHGIRFRYEPHEGRYREWT